MIHSDSRTRFISFHLLEVHFIASHTSVGFIHAFLAIAFVQTNAAALSPVDVTACAIVDKRPRRIHFEITFAASLRTPDRSPIQSISFTQLFSSILIYSSFSFHVFALLPISSNREITSLSLRVFPNSFA